MTNKILLALLFASLPAFAADSPWVGTWKLDAAKSHLVGDTFSYSKAPNGMLHMAYSTDSYDFAIDGKDYKAWAGRTMSWTADGPNAWNSVMKQDGVVVYSTHKALSADGKTLTVTTTGKKPDGSPMTDVIVYTRVGSGTGLLGKWRSTKADQGTELFTVSSPSPGVLRTETPAYKAVSEGKTDGTEFVPVGPTIPHGYTVSMKATGPRTLHYVYKVNGKPDGYSVDTVAADGKSFTSLSWSPGKESEKTMSVYVKQ